ncbi:Armadillo-type fold [Phytophthora cactorum]|nr:Armadillo-type fold [Phytophthora cactorum]
MSRSDHEDDWIGEVQHREGFVLDETEDVFAPPPPGKVMFTTSPATLQDLEDGSSTVLGLEPKPNDFGLGAASTGEESTKSQVFVGYRQVNPMFESCEPADVIFRTLHKAMRAQDVEFSCSPTGRYEAINASRRYMDAYTLIAAEELFFNVQLHRLAIKSTIRVDFNLRSGDELKFLGLTDSIRKECRAIDKDMIGLPELSFDILADWSAPGELFPGSLSVDSQELSMLLLEINSESPPFTRYEVAKRLKELCQYDSNRRALADLLKEQFVTGLQSMLKDDNEDIVRFAIYTILNFADDISTLNE